jgi:anthranilate synthase/aminodeoxychorismate synthase-like glutamine amidotransferase
VLLFIDNYDSFTYNLTHAFEAIGKLVVVKRYNELTLLEAKALNPTHLVIGPGPGSPKEVPKCHELILELGSYIPTLGVCLGHQCIAECFGGKIVHAKAPMHGKISKILHSSEDIFKGIPSPMDVGRYHSLVVEKSTLPSCLEVMAMTKEEEEIMAMKHNKYPIIGVQFHPESILTPQGILLLQNFIFKPFNK